MQRAEAEAQRADGSDGGLFAIARPRSGESAPSFAVEPNLNSATFVQ